MRVRVPVWVPWGSQDRGQGQDLRPRVGKRSAANPTLVDPPSDPSSASNRAEPDGDGGGGCGGCGGEGPGVLPQPGLWSTAVERSKERGGGWRGFHRRHVLWPQARRRVPHCQPTCGPMVCATQLNHTLAPPAAGECWWCPICIHWRGCVSLVHSRAAEAGAAAVACHPWVGLHVALAPRLLLRARVGPGGGHVGARAGGSGTGEAEAEEAEAEAEAEAGGHVAVCRRRACGARAHHCRHGAGPQGEDPKSLEESNGYRYNLLLKIECSWVIQAAFGAVGSRQQHAKVCPQEYAHSKCVHACPAPLLSGLSGLSAYYE